MNTLIKSFNTCKHTNKPVFTYKQIEFYGNGQKNDIEYTDFDVVIACGVTVNQNITVKNNRKTKLTFSSSFPTVISLKWPDFYIPEITKSFWTSLIKQLVSKNRSLKVLFCCIGGHGRTGTALSIIAGLLNLTKTPVKFIRQNYCDQAVETDIQRYYISKMTGCEIELEPKEPDLKTPIFQWERE